MALRQGERDDPERASYYVWFLGTEESRGLRGRQYVAPVVERLVRKERHVEPGKVTLQLSGKGMKIVQHVAAPGSGRAGQVKQFIPDHAVTCAVQEPPPDGDVVSCILLVFNPVTKCPVHVHTYRCDSPETAALLAARLQALAARPENQARIQQIEARLVARGLLAAPLPAAAKAAYQEDSSGIGSDDTPSPDQRDRTSSDEEWQTAGTDTDDLLQDSAPRWRHSVYSRTGQQRERPASAGRPASDAEPGRGGGDSSCRRPSSHRHRSPAPARPDRFEAARRRFSRLEDDREGTLSPPPLPHRPPPDVPTAEARGVRGQATPSRGWRLSRPPPDGSRGAAGAGWGAADPRRLGEEAAPEPRGRPAAPPGGEPRSDELLARVDRWVLSSLTAAEAPPGVRRRHSGRQHADERGRSPPAERAARRIAKSRSTDTFMEHDVSAPVGRQQPAGRRPAGHVWQEMRRQSVARDEPVPRSRSSPHVVDELRRFSVAREDEPVPRSRSSAHVIDDLRRFSVPREDADLQRSCSSTSLLAEQRIADRGRHREPRELAGRRGTPEREERRRPPRRRQTSYDSAEAARPERRLGRVGLERRPDESAARQRPGGGRTPEPWPLRAVAGHEARSRSRYSVADPRAMTRYDYQPGVTAQPY